MTAGPEKFTGHLPVFEKQQPFRRPRNDRGRDRHLRRPKHLGRIPKAQSRPSRVAFVPVDMRQQRLVRQHLRADERIDHVDGDVVIRKRPTIEERAPEVDDPNAIGLRRRLQRSFPDSDPVGVCRQTEVGEEPTNLRILLIDASINHRGGRRRIYETVPTGPHSTSPRRRPRPPG